MFERIYRHRDEGQPCTGSRLVRHDLQHRRKHGVRGSWTYLEILRMAGRGDNGCERSGDHDVARMAAVAGSEAGAVEPRFATRLESRPRVISMARLQRFRFQRLDSTSAQVLNTASCGHGRF